MRRISDTFARLPVLAPTPVPLCNLELPNWSLAACVWPGERDATRARQEVQ